MNVRTLLALALLAPAALSAPAAAQTLADTHEELTMPAGRIPTKLYRPLAADRCGIAQRHHQAGKLPAAPPVLHASQDDGCGKVRIASRDAATRRE